MEIYFELEAEIGKDFANDAANILNSWLKPFLDKAITNAEDDFRDSILENKYSQGDTLKMIRENLFDSLEMQTVKEKGRRIKTE